MKPSSRIPTATRTRTQPTNTPGPLAGTIRGLREPEVGLYPFWFWNGDQQEDELIRQIGMVHASGCKGIAIHARRGNRTPYLSDRWFALIRLMCGEARRLGLKIWIYDEDGYPSGNAGGRVQQADPDFIQQSLLFGYGPSDPAAPAFAASTARVSYGIQPTNGIPLFSQNSSIPSAILRLTSALLTQTAHLAPS